ncbi:hypothetical protein MYX19_01610 [Nitrospinae bacterium AH-259-F20]|nr:hypothetical protein [Nitrospinae bacterium AH-259-F20]
MGNKMKIELEIEELEERIAPARLTVAPPPFSPSVFFERGVGHSPIPAQPHTPVFDHNGVSAAVVTFTDD